MQLFDELFRQLFLRMIDDIVDTAEVVNCFNDIIHVNSTIRHTNGVCFKDIARLVVSQTTALYVIGVIGQVYLSAMIDAPFKPRAFLLPKGFQQGRHVPPACTLLR